MGIINTTPDSFFEGSRQQTVDSVLAQAERMLADGADWFDIGGQSTRPGAALVGATAEMERVIPAIEAIHSHFPDAMISIDTFHSEVAVAAVQAGAGMVNDVSGGHQDLAMLSTVADLKVPYVCMHMKGTPATMQHHAVYENVVQEVLDYFIERLSACRSAGIHDVIIDPGFGFAKTITHNFQLLNQLEAFQVLQVPLLLGVSRKSTIYKTLGVTANEALNGSTVLHTVGLMKGATWLRVHDVKEACEAVTLFQAMVHAL
jgi:dihydropteroate synthase